MKTLTALESKLYDLGRFATSMRVLVLDASLVWRDLTDLVGKDWLLSVEYDEHIDQPVGQCTVTQKRDSYRDTLGLVSTSRPNLLTGGYAQLVQVGREFRVEVAITPEMVPPASGDWREVFRGDIQVVSYGPDPMSFSGRELSGRLQDVFIEEERDYGSTMGTAIETVIQQIIRANHGSTWAASTVYSAGSGTQSRGPRCPHRAERVLVPRHGRRHVRGDRAHVADDRGQHGHPGWGDVPLRRDLPHPQRRQIASGSLADAPRFQCLPSAPVGMSAT